MTTCPPPAPPLQRPPYLLISNQHPMDRCFQSFRETGLLLFPMFPAFLNDFDDYDYSDDCALKMTKAIISGQGWLVWPRVQLEGRRQLNEGQGPTRSWSLDNKINTNTSFAPVKLDRNYAFCQLGFFEGEIWAMSLYPAAPLIFFIQMSF